jgi:hypothetical protein
MYDGENCSGKYHKSMIYLENLWHIPKLLDRLKCESEVKTAEG